MNRWTDSGRKGNVAHVVKNPVPKAMNKAVCGRTVYVCNVFADSQPSHRCSGCLRLNFADTRTRSPQRAKGPTRSATPLRCSSCGKRRPLTMLSRGRTDDERICTLCMGETA